MATQRDQSALPELARSLATLSAVGFSVVLATQLLWMQLLDRSNYTFGNVLGVPGRNRLLLSVAVGLSLPVLIALLVLWRQKGPGLASLHRTATLLAPLALVFVLPGLFLSQVAEGKPLFYLVALSAFGLASRARRVRSPSSRGVGARASVPTWRTRSPPQPDVSVEAPVTRTFRIATREPSRSTEARSASK